MNVEEPTTDFDEETTSELIEEDTIVGNTDGFDVIIVAIELVTSDSEVVVGVVTTIVTFETDFIAVTGSILDFKNPVLSLEDIMEVEALVLIVPDPTLVSNEDGIVIELALAVKLEELATDVVLLITWSLDEPIREDDDSISEVILDSVMVGIILGMKLLTDSEELIALDVTNVEATLTGLEVVTTVKLIFDVSCVLFVSTVDVKRIEEVSLKVTDE